MKRILIVDDAIDLGRMLQDALKKAYPDISVGLVPSAEESLLESGRVNIDLLITDLRLPGMTGLELIRKIRVRQPNIKVILMTGLTLDDRLNRQRAEANPDVFLQKPITIPAFLKAVERIFNEDPATPAPAPQPAHPKTEKERANDAILRELATVLPGESVPPKPKTATKRKGTGSLSLPSEPPPADEGLSGLLSRLRGSLGAITVMVLDDLGRPVAQAGDLPDLIQGGQIIPPLMASLSATARLSYLLGQTSIQSVHAFRGAGVDLVAAPAGQYTLLLALRAGRSTTRLALVFEEAVAAQAELAGVLESMGLHVQTAAEVGAPETLLAEASEEDQAQEEAVPPEILETPLGQDQSLQKFEEVFTRKKTGELRLQDPDAFWDDVTSGEHADLSQSGVLSLDQAQKLGLMPDESKAP
ncbi:MAG TPA: response regulator [Anaerolineaceae bacterium]